MNAFAPAGPLPHRSARRRLRPAVRDGERRPLDALARVGYAAHGVVYLLVGALAARVAFLHRGRAAGPSEAVGDAKALLGGGLDTALLAVLAVGLFAYALWRLAQAVVDPDRDDASRRHPLVSRIGRAGSGLLYAGIALTTARLALGASSATAARGADAPEWTARALAAPFGAVLVAAVGVGFIAVGAGRARRARRATFLRELDLSRLDHTKRRAVELLGRFGYAARAVVFAIVGAFLIVAAVQRDPQEARGLGGALRTLAAQPWGTVLLGVVALGLLAFGAFEIARGLTKRETPA